MKKARIQLNELFCEQRPTTQEDNYGGIRERWDLYANDYDGIEIGKMVQYMNSNYAIFVSGLRFDLSLTDIQFI
jgi:cobalamin biosynthesis Co2+ chelatase CbiK